MTATTNSEIDALRATQNTRCAVFKYAQRVCVALQLDQFADHADRCSGCCLVLPFFRGCPALKLLLQGLLGVQIQTKLQII